VTAVPEPETEVGELGPDDSLEYAWAAHRRVLPPGGGSVLRALSGSAVGTACALLEERRRARTTPAVEEFLEVLQRSGRAIAAMFLPDARRLSGEPDHDCDCTCAGEEGHARWMVGEPAWLSAEIGPLLLRLASGERVRVRLDAPSSGAQRGRATALFGSG
jgi:hypothetical protein